MEIAPPEPDFEHLDLDLKAESASRGANALAAVRGSYGGILMFGMIGSLAGLALLNPLTAVVGIGLGRRALKEEKKRQLTARRQQAKMTARKFVDEVTFGFGKDCRDLVRGVQRELRDEFTNRADELQRSVHEALTNADTSLAEDKRCKRKPFIIIAILAVVVIGVVLGEVIPVTSSGSDESFAEKPPPSMPPAFAAPTPSLMEHWHSSS